MRVIFLSGVAATGKTSIINAILARNSIDYSAMPSITRGVYLRHNIFNETTLLNSPEDIILSVQKDIFHTYISKVIEFCLKSDLEGKKLVLIDRSPYDHLSYLSSKYSRLNIIPILARNSDLAHDMMELLKNYSPKIVYLPYPNSWNKQDEISSDNFRDDGRKATLAWDENLKSKLFGNYSIPKAVPITNLVKPDASIEERAHAICHLA